MDLPLAADVLAQPTRTRLYALLRGRQKPAATAELAQALGLHPNGVRAHLEQMQAVGLVVRSRTRQARGRPRDTWTATPATEPAAADHAEGPRAAVGQDALTPIADEGYEQLAELRAGLRRYLAWAEERAREHDLTPAQFQLALAVRASSDPAGPTLTELADTLLLRHHSVVGLVDRAEDSGLVTRLRDPVHASRVHVQLTERGRERLSTLSGLHLRRLAELAPQMQALWGAFGDHAGPRAG
jgi:DNA-binding MarR family transcriptional regulator